MSMHADQMFLVLNRHFSLPHPIIKTPHKALFHLEFGHQTSANEFLQHHWTVRKYAVVVQHVVTQIQLFRAVVSAGGCVVFADDTQVGKSHVTAGE